MRGQPSPYPGSILASRVCLLPADGRRHGDDDSEHPCTAAALRVAAAQLAGGVADLGRQPSGPLLSCSVLVPCGGVFCRMPPLPPAAAKGSADRN